MGMKNINAARKSCKKAKENLEDVILEELARVALKRKLTKMVFYSTTTLYKGDVKVECSEIDKIEQIYLDEINPHGFIAMWTKENGWE